MSIYRHVIPKVRLLYKIWAVSVPLTVLTFAASLWKAWYPCFGGCPATYDANNNLVFPTTSTDWTVGVGLLIIPALIFIFGVYMPGYVAGYWEHDN